MIQVNHAILHSFELEIGEKNLSSQELDLDNKKTKSFVSRHLRKAANNVENNHGEFASDSGFADELSHYIVGHSDFIEFSQQLADFFYTELRKGDDATPCDLLVAEFTDTVSAGDVVVSEEAADQAFDGDLLRYFALLLLPRREIFVHSMSGYEGKTLAEILRTDAALPNPTQKIDSYAVINCDNMTVAFKDKPRTIAGMQSYLIPDGLLRCSKEASSKETIEAVNIIVEDIAEEYGLNTAVALSRAKAYVSENVDHEQAFNPQEVGRAVFQDAPEQIEKYEEKLSHKVETEAIPERVEVKKSQATRMVKNHKIKTDTGIEITFPSEYASSAEFIEFSTDSDGLISIQLKNITKIENR